MEALRVVLVLSGWFVYVSAHQYKLEVHLHSFICSVPVPKGFVVTCSAFRAFLEANKLDLETCTAEDIIAGQLPSTLAQEITTQVFHFSLLLQLTIYLYKQYSLQVSLAQMSL